MVKSDQAESNQQVEHISSKHLSPNTVLALCYMLFNSAVCFYLHPQNAGYIYIFFNPFTTVTLTIITIPV